MRDAIADLLKDDSELMSYLTGGVYSSADVEGQITRQTAPNAFDSTKEVLPCALVKWEAETPTGPFNTSTMFFVAIILYEHRITIAIDAAIERIFMLLHQNKMAGTWEVRNAGETRDMQDETLSAQMHVARYQGWRLR